MTSHFVLVLAADRGDYEAWCRATGRIPLATSARAVSPWDGYLEHGHRRTFQVTDRWREDEYNRRILDRLRMLGVPYGGEGGPWPAERIPDLAWPSRWRRILRRWT